MHLIGCSFCVPFLELYLVLTCELPVDTSEEKLLFKSLCNFGGEQDFVQRRVMGRTKKFGWNQWSTYILKCLLSFPMHVVCRFLRRNRNRTVCVCVNPLPPHPPPENLRPFHTKACCDGKPALLLYRDTCWTTQENDWDCFFFLRCPISLHKNNTRVVIAASSKQQ